MYLLYADESGSVDDPQADIFVLSGICVFERQTHWLDERLTQIAARFNPDAPEDIELHAGPMRTGREGWKSFSPSDRVQAAVDALHLLSNKQLKLRVFACVLQKSLYPPSEIVATAFEKIAACFDNYLWACFTKSKGKNPQRGIVLFDESIYEQNVQLLSRVFKHEGHEDGHLRNFAEVPLFLDSKASRLIQMADIVAYWIYRYYQAHDCRGFDLIKPYIHSYNGGRQGLIELVSDEKLAEIAASPNADNDKYPFPAPTPDGSVLPAVKMVDVEPPA